MSGRGDSALRQIALKALAQREGSGSVADAAQRAYDDLARAAAPLIGQVGIDALTGRALYLAQQTFPWLIPAREAGQWNGPIAQIVLSLEQQEPAAATEAAGALLAVLVELLVTFIGEPLTARLLQEAWPDAFIDAESRRQKA